MRIIVLDEEFPFPLNTGKRIRTFNLISRLAQKHRILYLAYGSTGSESFTALANVGVTPIAVKQQIPEKSGLQFYYRLAKNILSPLPYIVDSHYSKAFGDILAEQIRIFKPDLLLSEWSPYAIYGWNWQNIKQVIVAHNIESQIWRRYYENESNPFKHWYIKKQHDKVLDFERTAFSRAHAATAVTRQDADELHKINPTLPVEVVDNGVDLAYFSPQQTAIEPGYLVFTGSMDWRPNQDAALYFAKEILPVLQRTHPDVRAVFVGRNPPAHIRALERIDGIRITGTVDDVRPFIAKAAAYIVPLRIGGGSRLKILEALSMEKAVISTRIGAEGLEVQDGKHLLVADMPETFAATIARVLDNRPLAQQLGVNGRTLVSERYGWDSLAQKLDRFLEKIIAS